MDESIIDSQKIHISDRSILVLSNERNMISPMNTDTSRILLINTQADENLAIRSVLEKSQPPFRIKSVTSIAQANEQIPVFKPHLVLSEMNLSDGTATELIGTTPNHPQLPLIVLLDTDADKKIMEVINAGALDCVVKTPEAIRVMPLIADRAMRQWRYIQQRIQVETALRESEARYRAIVEGFDGHIYVVSEDYRIQFANEKLIQYVGENIIGQACFKAIHQRSRVCPWCVNHRVFAGETIRWETLRAVDNRWYYIVNTPIHHQNGAVSKLAMIMDITERKKMEEDLRKSEEKFSRAFKLSPDILVITRFSDGMVLDCNESFLKITGYSRKQIIGKPVKTLQIWANNKDQSMLRERLVENGQCDSIEIYFRSATGDLIPTLLSARIIEIGNEKCAISIARDISEVKQVEAELKRHRDHLDELVQERTQELTKANEKLQKEIQERKQIEEALRASEYKYKTLFENLPQFIFYKDRNSVYVSCNQHYARELGIKPEEIVGKTDYDFFPRELAEKYRKDDQRIILSGELEEIEERYYRNGRERIIQTVKTPMRDETGNTVGIQGIFWDITKRKAVEAENVKYQHQLRSLSSQLLVAEEHERRRIANDLHDRIGQALAISKIKLGIIQEQINHPEIASQLEEVRKYIEQTINDTRSLTFEISPPVLYDFGLEAAIEWLTDRIREEYKLDISCSDDGLPKPLSDGTSILLFRATRELIFNIIKHANASKAQVTVTRNGHRVQICIEDNGIGFNPDEVASRSQVTGEYGLFSIKERLSHLGGELVVKSGNGNGTRVLVQAPLDLNSPLGLEATIGNRNNLGR